MATIFTESQLTGLGNSRSSTLANPKMFDIFVDLTTLPAVLITADTVEIMTLEKGQVLGNGASVAVVEPMTGTSLVGALFNLEEDSSSTDLSGTVSAVAVADVSSEGVNTVAVVADDDKLVLVFALTSGTVLTNGKYRVRFTLTTV
jgi:hypothetical protein